MALRKSDQALDLTKYPKVSVTASDQNDQTLPDSSGGEQKPHRPKKRSGTDSIATKINETVELKKGLKVALRKSAKALNLTKYPKVTVGNEDSTSQKSSDSTTPDAPTIKFADSIKATETNDTVHLMKNLKLSLSKSARAIDLRKYPKVTVGNDSENQAETSEVQSREEIERQNAAEIAKEKAEREAAQQKAQQEQVAKQKAEREAAQQKAQQEQVAKQKAEKEAAQRKVAEEQLTQKEGPDQLSKVGVEKKEAPEGSTPVKKPKRLLTQQSRTIPKIMDPTRRRDNATVKLAAAQTGSFAASAEDQDDESNEPNSDTVVLKVIKEKKKKLAGILSASQTIRLRPPTEPGFTPGSATPPATEPAIPKKTLKLKTPGATAESDQGAPQTLERRVLKLKPSAPAPTSQPVPTAQGEQTTVRRSENQKKIQKSGTPTAKATLKIKVPASEPGLRAPKKDADGRELKSTLKIKAPAATTRQAPPRAAGTAGKAVAQGARSAPGKTLKLKAVPRSEFQQAPPTTTATQADIVQPSGTPHTKDSVSIETDVFYTISAAASLAVIGGAIYFMASQFTSFF